MVFTNLYKLFGRFSQVILFLFINIFETFQVYYKDTKQFPE